MNRDIDVCVNAYSIQFEFNDKICFQNGFPFQNQWHPLERERGETMEEMNKKRNNTGHSSQLTMTQTNKNCVGREWDSTRKLLLLDHVR